jgi:hypothetical protein
MEKLIIFNIDDPRYVEKSINNVTKDWFDPKSIYFSLKASGITDTGDFWHVTESLLENIAHSLCITYEDFIREFKDRCNNLDLRIMAYHCTRSRRPQDYLKHGILPLSEKVLCAFLSESSVAFPTFSLSEEDKESIIGRVIQTDAWNYRGGTGAGPYFFLSYQEAKDQNNDFLRSGSEIWWVCVDNLIQYCSENYIRLPTTNRDEWREKIRQNMKAVIIHCLIPYSFLSKEPYYAFCMFRSFFNNLDPEDDSVETGSIDLRGKSLDPQYITKIEEM